MDTPQNDLALSIPNERDSNEYAQQNADVATTTGLSKRTESQKNEQRMQNLQKARETSKKIQNERIHRGLKSKRSKSEKAGTIFPVHRILESMRKSYRKYRITETAGVYTSAVLEYMCSEIFDLAGISARDNRRKRIIPRDIRLAINSDDELIKLLSNVVIAHSGVTPFIHEVLLAKKSKKAIMTSKKEATKMSKKATRTKKPATKAIKMKSKELQKKAPQPRERSVEEEDDQEEEEVESLFSYILRTEWDISFARIFKISKSTDDVKFLVDLIFEISRLFSSRIQLRYS